MHCCLRCRCCSRWIRPRQYPYTREDKLDSMGWSRLHCYIWCVYCPTQSRSRLTYPVLLVTVAVGIQGGPSTAPPGWSSDYKIINHPSFAEGVSAVSTLIFACSATPAYFSLAAEMRDPRYFTRALVVSQIGSTLLYLVVGVVVYYYCGTMVASPALGSAGTLIKRIAYGLSLPGLIATTTIVIHVCFSPYPR